MELLDAWRLLGIEPTTDPDAVRSAYASRLHLVHPDHSPAPDANLATAELTVAYQLVQTRLARDSSLPPAPEAAGPGRASATEIIPIGLVADDTIAVALPAGETYGLLVEAAHRLGEVVHIEPSSAMLQVIVTFLEAPTCQLLLTLQGRATGVTEVFCTLESIEPEAAPPIVAVTQLLVDELVAVGRARAI